MDNIKTVTIGPGNSRAVITLDNSLYMWKRFSLGFNQSNYICSTYYTPKKMLDNVKEISPDWFFSAAITWDGSLYTWGENNQGQLGNGTMVDSDSPIKIMDNVETISSSSSYCAAITTDGTLYTWGKNGFTTDSVIPPL